MARSWREKLADRWGDFPLMRLLVCTPFFAAALFSALLVVLLLLAALPRFFTTSPRGFEPVVKVSLLDLLRARSAKKQAATHAARGEWTEAWRQWRAADARNHADVELWRSAFQAMAGAPQLPSEFDLKRLGPAADWFLRLSGTNRTDVSLVASVYEKLGASNELCGLLAGLGDGRTSREEAAYMRALFLLERHPEFERRWLVVHGMLEGEPSFASFRAAYLAGWGEGELAEEGARRLHEYMADPGDVGAEARRLALVVAWRRGDAREYGRCLQGLEERGQASPADHARLWRLLSARGAADEARRLAREFNRVPTSPADVIAVADALGRLGLNRECIDFLERHAPDFARQPSAGGLEIWSVYAGLLIRFQAWEGLRDLATRLRSYVDLHQSLGGFVHYLDGRFTFGHGAREAAKAEFQEAVRLGLPPGQFASAVGGDLLGLGFPDLSLELLRPLQEAHGDDLEFWKVLYAAASRSRQDEVTLLAAARRTYELDPDEEAGRLDYATALLVRREEPEKVIALLQPRGEAGRPSPRCELSLAWAFAQAGKADEASRLLEGVDPAQLGPDDRTLQQQTVLELCRLRQDWPQARVCLGTISRADLFPTQARWVEELTRTMRAQQTGPGG